MRVSIAVLWELFINVSTKIALFLYPGCMQSGHYHFR